MVRVSISEYSRFAAGVDPAEVMRDVAWGMVLIGSYEGQIPAETYWTYQLSAPENNDKLASSLHFIDSTTVAGGISALPKHSATNLALIVQTVLEDYKMQYTCLPLLIAIIQILFSGMLLLTGNLFSVKSAEK